MKPIQQWTSADIQALFKGIDQRTWLIVAAFAVGALLFAVFLVIPAWVDRPSLRRNVQNMETQIRLVNDLNRKRPGLEEKRKAAEAFLGECRQRVFTSQDADKLLGQLSKMAGEARVDIQASKPLEEKTVFTAPYHLKYQPCGYEFIVKGGYHDLGELVSRIESCNKFLVIRSLSIAADKETPNRHVAELKLWAVMEPPAPATAATGVNHAKK